MGNKTYRAEFLSGLCAGALAAIAGLLLGTLFSGCGVPPVELQQLPAPESSPLIIYIQPSPIPCDCADHCKRNHK